MRAGEAREVSKRGDSAVLGPVLRNGLDKALNKGEIEGFTFHDLRQTFVANMRKAGKQDRSIMKITGNKTMSVLQRYDTVDRAAAESG